MEYENLLLTQKSSILILTINRENKLNALNKATLAELHTAVSDALQNKSIRGMIITGAGNKAFVAGADITELQNLSADEGRDMAQEAHSKVFNLIENSEKPIIAAINGFALGGGLELAMACHIRLASANAKMGLPELTLGLIPGYGGTQRLTQLVGKGKAMEMILTSEMIGAEEAFETGLVNHVVEQTELLAESEKLLQKILNNPSRAIGSAIRAINASNSREGFNTEIAEFSSCFGTKEFKEGVSAFLEKRKPSFR